MRILALPERISVILLLFLPALPLQAEPSDARQQVLIDLLRQDCGSCHGMTLKGGLGPALTPERLRDKPAAMLVETILAGRPGTPMPPWSAFMTREEARWLVDNLKRGLDQ